ncbi:eukaryotic translation initiation factor 2 subunit beta [Quercus suber]|uniref:Eukaryotic translation initiation factor 2 subunit beta n=1 Tax=Quercus suber TaxID=58331 RepID=A0AAW0L6V5_QUESU
MSIVLMTLQLLSRVFNIFCENILELAGDKCGTIMRPLQVFKGPKEDKCFYCFRLHRVEHVMTFLPSEIGTSGSLGGQPQLVVWSRFAPKSFEGILQRCISEYIIVIILFPLGDLFGYYH